MYQKQVEQVLETPGLADEVAEAIEEQRWPEELGAFYDANRPLMKIHELSDTLVIDVWYAIRIKEGRRPGWHEFFPIAKKVLGLDISF